VLADMLGRSLPAQAFEMGRTVKNFLIGLVVLPVVVVAAMLVYPKFGSSGFQNCRIAA